jgi:hypothetical protein
VKTLAENGSRQSELFPSTHWSVVLAAGRSQAEPELARAALSELCQTYWAPLYNFVLTAATPWMTRKILHKAFLRI